jgi:hypothetical protein
VGPGLASFLDPVFSPVSVSMPHCPADRTPAVSRAVSATRGFRSIGALETTVAAAAPSRGGVGSLVFEGAGRLLFAGPPGRLLR